MSNTPAGREKAVATLLGISLEELREKRAAGLKRCQSCQHWLPLGSFGSDRSRGDGKRTTCVSCGLGLPPGEVPPPEARDILKRERMKFAFKRRVGFVPPLKGKKMSEAGRDKIRLSHRLHPRPGPMVGRRHSKSSRLKISSILRERASRGPTHHAYKDGKVAERRGLRFCPEYKRWRYDVFVRDNFACRKCGDDRGGNLEAHHIDSFADYPALRFEVSNGITLCEKCHDAEHATGGANVEHH